MSEQPTITKAQLIEIDLATGDRKSDGKSVSVQFNPESLKVTFANQIVPPSGAGDQNGSASMQFVGAGTTKLALTIWFDVTALEDGENTKNDVRILTEDVAYFITPKKNDDSPPKFIPPGVRFLWGTFQFDGLMDSMEESLDYFSNDGRPLRASIAFSLSQQKIQFQRGQSASAGKRPPAAPNSPVGAPGSGRAGPGTNALTPAAPGSRFRLWRTLRASSGKPYPTRHWRALPRREIAGRKSRPQTAS